MDLISLNTTNTAVGFVEDVMGPCEEGKKYDNHLVKIVPK
jgi:hypothetical protein